MRHIILASAGTYGDVFPFIALGLALRGRGHRVTLAANEEHRALAAELGFGFAALVSDEETHALLSDRDLWRPLRAARVGVRWAAGLLRRHYELLNGLAEDGDAVLAASPAIMAARLVQETRGRPLASVYQMPWIIPSCTAPPIMMGGWTLPRWAPRPLGRLYWRLLDLGGGLALGGALNGLRAELGLEPVRRVFRWWVSPDLAIGLFPGWYAPPQPDWPAQLRVAGFPMFEGLAGGPPVAEALSFCRAGDPPVVFTFGTGMMHAADLFRESAEACLAAGVRGVLLTRQPDQLPDALPDSIRHFEYVPLRQLLPHCAAIVHHGGIGTVSKALASGVPQLIIPHAWDQLDNAQRVVRLGAGRVLRRGRARADRLAGMIGALRAPGLAARCREVAGRFDGEPGVHTAARWIEELQSGATSSGRSRS